MSESVSAVNIRRRYGGIGGTKINTIYKRKAINGSFLSVPTIRYYNLLNMLQISHLLITIGIIRVFHPILLYI